MIYRILIYFICIATFQSLFAEERLVIKLSNGENVDCNHIFLEKDNPIFSLGNAEEFSIVISIVADDSNNLKNIQLEKIDNIKEFQFFPDKYKKQFIDTKYEEAINDTQYAHVVELKVTYDDSVITYPLRFLLKPSKPQIVNGEYFGTWSTELVDFEDRNSHLRLTIETENATRINIYRSGEWFFRSELPVNKRVFLGMGTIHDVDSQKKTHVIETCGSWGRFLRCSSSNDYGYVRGDTIFTTDFVTDPKILNDIDMLEMEYAGIQSTDCNQSNIHLSSSHLYFTNEEYISNVSIYTSNGKCIYNQTNGMPIKIDAFAPGLY
ncbi:MAG: hypothetical protein K2L41_08985, partial [Muribaculaceae bacterium]|nr:hypothetical protein [Muribaculaceae bacterium]